MIHFQVKPQTLFLEEDVTMNAERKENFTSVCSRGTDTKFVVTQKKCKEVNPHQALVDQCFIALVHPCCRALVHIHVDGPSHLHGCQQLDIQDIVQIHPKGKTSSLEIVSLS